MGHYLHLVIILVHLTFKKFQVAFLYSRFLWFIFIMVSHLWVFLVTCRANSLCLQLFIVGWNSGCFIIVLNIFKRVNYFCLCSVGLLRLLSVSCIASLSLFRILWAITRVSSHYCTIFITLLESFTPGLIGGKLINSSKLYFDFPLM